MKWFKHDSDAHRDAKLRKVQMKYGMEGYGLYWYCLELICGGVSDKNISFELEHDAEIISHDTGIHVERVVEMLMYMVRLNLFEESQGVISCLKMMKRLDSSMTSSPALRKLFTKTGQGHAPALIESSGSHDGVMTESAIPMQDKTRQDQTINSWRRFTPPEVSEVEERIQEMGYRFVTGVEFCSFYGSKGWKVGKSPMVDWKQALAGWESREKKKRGPVEVEHYH